MEMLMLYLAALDIVTATCTAILFSGSEKDRRNPNKYLNNIYLKTAFKNL